MATELVGTTEAAEICGVNRATFFKWMQAGRIHPVAKLGKGTAALVFDRSHVEALLEEQERRKRFKACPECNVPTWGPCEHQDGAA